MKTVQRWRSHHAIIEAMGESEAKYRRRAAWILASVLFAELVLVLLVCIAVVGCAPVREVGDCDGELGCSCIDASECDGWGQGGERGTCGPQDVCTLACASDDDCDGIEDAVCGPMQVRGVDVCTVGGER